MVGDEISLPRQELNARSGDNVKRNIAGAASGAQYFIC